MTYLLILYLYAQDGTVHEDPYALMMDRTRCELAGLALHKLHKSHGLYVEYACVTQ